MSSDFSQRDRMFMQHALELGKKAASLGEVPVGALLVQEQKIIGEGHNQPISAHDTTAHAEIVAIRQACQNIKNYRLPHATLYVSLEPCAMCAGALIHARVARVVCAAREPRAGAAGSVLDVMNNPRLNHCCVVEFGLLQDASSALLKSFFKARRS